MPRESSRFALAVVLVAGSAIADPPKTERAALVALELGPKVPAYVRGKATTQIEEGLAAAGYHVLPFAQVAPKLSADLTACRAGPCVKDVGAAVGVDALVFAKITSQDENTVITLRLLDAATTEQIAEVRELCELCGEAELDEHLGVAASALRMRATEARERRARDEAARPKPPPLPPPAVEPEHSVVPGVVVGGLGLAAIGAGIYLLAIDGHGTCHRGDTPVYPAPGAVIRYTDPSMTQFVCRDVYDTKLLGASAIGVGAIGLAAATYLFLRARHHDEHAVALTPLPRGAAVGVTLAW